MMWRKNGNKHRFSKCEVHGVPKGLDAEGLLRGRRAGGCGEERSREGLPLVTGLAPGMPGPWV